MVTPSITLIPSLAQGGAQVKSSFQSGSDFDVTFLQVDEWRVKEQTLERLSAIQPLLSEIMDVKLVVQPRKNMLNIRVKPEYVTLMWHKELETVRYCFFMSDKLEPCIIPPCPLPV